MPIFATTIFIGAVLLFLLQPLIAKYILPWYGGAPNVWTTCMLSFQVLLVGGYAYAHLISRWLKPRAQAVLHTILVLGALAVLPITPSDSWKPDGSGNPTLQILGLLTVNIGLPYFVLSSTGPLLQRWLCQIHPGIQPFRLYALSNLGSMLALLSFPFLFEPHFTRAGNVRLWSWGLVAYAAGSIVCAIKLWRTALPAAPGGRPAPPAATRPGFSQTIFWLLLPACASVLLLATTNKICQEVAVIPFLWVLPLALYLLSFAICFDHPRWYLRLPFGLALIAILSGICHVLLKGTQASVSLQIGTYSAGLFICCMVCHGELYRLKPEPRHLTWFYLLIAIGGALGGLFVAVIAPLIFTGFYEFHWGLFLCGLLFLLLVARDRAGDGARRPFRGFRYQRAVTCVALTAGLLALGTVLWRQTHESDNLLVQRSRNFYGTLAVLKHDDDPSKGQWLALLHGRTLHGVQFSDPQRSRWPTLYYSEKSGVGLAMGALPDGPRRIGLVGLGIGTLAAYARPGDDVHVYEINPEVYRIATSEFTYLSNCLGTVEVTLGDARLSLEREPPQDFDLLALDAFSDDTVPVHLLTREAFTTYERHLKTNGIIAIHISSASLNLEPVLANVARHFDYQTATIDYVPVADAGWASPSIWVLLSRNKEVIRSPAIRLASRPPLTNSVNIRLWTDDFTSLFQILRSDSANYLDAQNVKAESELAQHLFLPGDPAGTIAGYRRALTSHPNSPILLNNQAFLLATSPDPALRNPSEAIQLAVKACELTRYRAPAMVATLAAVYSEAGQFPEAAAMQEKVCALTVESGQQVSLQQEHLLQLYRAGRPYHESLDGTDQTP